MVPFQNIYLNYSRQCLLSCNGDSNAVGLSTIANGASNTCMSSNVETHQLPPRMVASSPTGGNVDMDATIIMDNSDNNGGLC